MSGERKQTIFKYSAEVAEKLQLDFCNREFNYGKGCGRADNSCMLGDKKLLILEIEFSQRHPEANVLKAWPYLMKNPESNVFLIQYIVNTKAVSPNRLEICKWIGERMEIDLKGRFSYHLIENELENITEFKKRIKAFHA